MFKNTGSLIYQDYQSLLKKNKIIAKNFLDIQIQPSSVDLTLSEECYEIKYSFLSPKNSVRKNLHAITTKKINLNKKYTFKKNKTFIIKLNESLDLPNNIFGMCNPKSSTGRLDIFCRTIMDYSDEYEKIPANYKGEMFIEITSRSFDIELEKGDSLNQMRLIYNKHLYVSDQDLKKFHNKNFLTLNNYNKKIIPNLLNGLKISVDLCNDNEIKAYVAKSNAPKLNFKKIKFYNSKDYWKSIKTKNQKIIIEK